MRPLTLSDVYATGEGAVFRRVPDGSPVHIGTLGRYRSRWRFTDTNARTDGVGYYTKQLALEGLVAHLTRQARS